MKVTELRIGNIINIPFFGTGQRTVTASDIASIAKYKTEIYGIPLTIEWLLRFGFKTYGAASIAWMTS